MLEARQIVTSDDLEILRLIRNSGRQWMTRNTSEITSEQQHAWWDQFDHSDCTIRLFRVALTDIGYGLLRTEGGRVWCSLAVLPQFRGQGYGTMIYRWLALATPVEVWAEILADNTPSIRACLRAGYQIAFAADKTATLVYRKEIQGAG